MINPIKFINFQTRTVLFSMMFLLLTFCSKKEKDPKILEMEEKVLKISIESKIPVEQLEKIGIEMDELQRGCGVKFSQSKEKKEIREKKTLNCRIQAREELFKKNNIPTERINDMIEAHMILQWEWKYFQKEQKADLAILKKIYSDGMAGMFQCMKLSANPGESKEALDRRIDDCAEKRFYQICADKNFDTKVCGKIISMGTDYGWEMESEKKTQMINPNSPESKN